MNTWIVVADTARARFFRVARQQSPARKLVHDPLNHEPTDVLVEIEALFHPESRLPDRALASDAPGLSSVAGMRSKFGMDEKVTPKEAEGIRFAKELALVLKAQNRHYDRLYLIAPSHFLGLLRSSLDASVSTKIVLEIDQDLSRLGAEEIRGHLPAPLGE